MKKIILVLDGIVDRAVDGMTPMMKAHTPYLDELSRCGVMLRVKTVPDGYRIGSDFANMTLMGLDPRKDYPGRSALEMLGIGQPIPSGQFTYRMNLISFKSGSRCLESANAHGVTDEEQESLFEALEKVVSQSDLELFGIGGHVFLLKGKTQMVSLDAPTDKFGYDLAYQFRGDRVLETLCQKIEKVLKGHPVNIRRSLEGRPTIDGAWIWARGQSLEPLKHTKQSKWGIVTGTPIIKGLARLKGDDVIQVEGATGALDTDYSNKIRAALAALSRYDVVYCHVESPDTAAHLRDSELKKRVIESIDERLFAVLYEELKRISGNVEVYVISDHGTCSETGEHFGDVMPCLHVIAPWRRGLNMEPFNEEAGKDAPILDDHQWIKRFG
ncbi:MULTISPECIES: hypothetical protein [unclassified Fusibacter]|uniref:hypothetical protein n=1 Tax=unclassified Fusibacter TaxID=2624464 RepID=UPI0010103A82|nr:MULTISPECIES: hypothetical protein [unclassified Fusibacter]MCK8059644.1 hypothetical protein [Fusibacter sp. A2]NPE21445.1 hypothetical protein [Fusibacter sp. A1]RXV61856.1 hypothetical protein DWB64_06360 [Fusibacter sp. A1]